jgi:hypothetical protein
MPAPTGNLPWRAETGAAASAAGAAMHIRSAAHGVAKCMSTSLPAMNARDYAAPHTESSRLG